MEEQIRGEIIRFVMNSELNLFPDSSRHYFDEPLVGFAAADDQLFNDYKSVIGQFHLTPQEVMQQFVGTGAVANSVISWILPVTTETRSSNRVEDRYPSKAWAQTRNFGEHLNSALRRHLVSWLEERGESAVAPQITSGWKEFQDTPVGIASTWSERHAAYAAGLGTFSLNDALITPKGIGHRCGSVVTGLKLMPTARPYPNHQYNCLYYRDGSCGACIRRCPIGAISKSGHDKTACSVYVYDTVVASFSEQYGVTATGCGLCQTRVPCENQIPPDRKKRE